MHNKIKKSGTIILLAASLLGSFNLPAQKDNRFEVSKQLDIFNAIVKETEMFYVDSAALTLTRNTFRKMRWRL